MKTTKHRAGKRILCLMLCMALSGGAWAGAVDYTCPDCGKTVHVSDVADVAEKALPSVVSITNISVREAQQYFDRYGHNSTELRETTSAGSGVIFEKTADMLYILTNYHVVEGAATLSVGFVDDEVYKAQLCGINPTRDIAVVKVPLSLLSSSTRSKIAVAPLGDSTSLRVGEQVVAIGNALGLRPVGHDRHRQRTEPLGSDRHGQRGQDGHGDLYPDGRRHQPGQQRRCAAQYVGRGHRRQHRKALLDRRRGHGLCYPGLRNQDHGEHPENPDDYLDSQKADRHEPLLLLPQQIKRTERMQTKPHTLFCCADAECAVR